ncbi:hypothetical protein FQN49_003939 [Arthroderma sp. PD_2]|nr:hypothetical protein FQN49_003939 [Arthroderma sp. PD_2]
MVLLRKITLFALLGSGVTASNAAYFKRAEDASSTAVVTTSAASVEAKATPMASSSSSSSSSSSATPSPTADDSETQEPTGTEEPEPQETGKRPKDAPTCNSEKDVSVKPFCSPHDNDEVYTGDTYYVTWVTSLLDPNATVKVGMDYVNVTANEGPSAFLSRDTDNNRSYIAINMKPDWLKGEKRNNLTMFLDEFPPGKDRIHHPGPTISLTDKPSKPLPPPPPTPAPTALGLLVGLPLGLGALALVLVGLCIGMKKHRQIGLSNIMGRRNKGYGGRSARAMRSGRGAGGSIRLDDMEDNGQQYSDYPVPSREHIVSDTEAFNDVQRREGNAFRQELARLKNWR